uniref:Uncharacterized protein n=1 Tax=Salix viminalis TaxID=40686 RepID=A0A6N2N3C9_SALVM
MERNSFCSNLKDHSIGSKASNNSTSNSKKLRDSWNFSSCQSYGEDYLDGLSWPPDPLGGHMNVHRRDRARLRRSPPRDAHSELSDLTTTETRKSFFSTENFGGFTQKDGFKIWKKAEIVRLDLEIGLVRDSKDDLDLELRLGSLN